MKIKEAFAVMETENLRLRRIEPGDIRDIFEMRSDPLMHEYTDTMPDATPEETAAYIERMNRGMDDGRWVIWAMEDKQQRKVVGSICLWNLNPAENSAELGYGIVPACRNRGLMREALMGVADHAFREMRIGILRAYTEESNLPSGRLLQRCGFVRTGHADEPGSQADRIYHMDIYELNAMDEYPKT